MGESANFFAFILDGESPEPVWPGLLIEEREQHSLLRADVLLPAKTVTGVECRVHKTYLGPGARPVEARHAARRLTREKFISINKSL